MAYSRQEGEFLTSQGETETLSPDPYDEQLLENERTTKNPFYWIWVVFRLSDTEIERKAGKGAVHYLSFQSYLISSTVVRYMTCIDGGNVSKVTLHSTNIKFS